MIWRCYKNAPLEREEPAGLQHDAIEDAKRSNDDQLSVGLPAVAPIHLITVCPDPLGLLVVSTVNARVLFRSEDETA